MVERREKPNPQKGFLRLKTHTKRKMMRFAAKSSRGGSCFCGNSWPLTRFHERSRGSCTRSWCFYTLFCPLFNRFCPLNAFFLTNYLYGETRDKIQRVWHDKVRFGDISVSRETHLWFFAQTSFAVSREFGKINFWLTSAWIFAKRRNVSASSVLCASDVKHWGVSDSEVQMHFWVKEHTSTQNIPLD
jgi:hypothetical protein